MVKGMTRRIVEIKGSGNGCFERAIFFVRMDMPSNTPEYTLTQEASRIIDEFCTGMEVKKTPLWRRIGEILRVAGAALLGAAVAVVVVKLGVLF